MRTSRGWPFLALLAVSVMLLTLGHRNIIPSVAKDNAARHASDAHHANMCAAPNVLVAIKSGGSDSKYRNRRQKWRQSPCAKSYREHGVTFRFMVGLPIHRTLDPNSHNQAARDTPEEIEDLLSLRKEQEEYEDIVVLPLRDIYDDLFVKTFQILQWLEKEATGEVVVVHDDEYCANLQELEPMCTKAVSLKSNLYGGNHLWRKAVYTSQPSFDGSFSPYFSGWLYALSVSLVREIIADKDTILSGIYASHSEDLQVGRWVQKQQKRNDTAPVLYAENPHLLVFVDAEEANS